MTIDEFSALQRWEHTHGIQEIICEAIRHSAAITSDDRFYISSGSNKTRPHERLVQVILDYWVTTKKTLGFESVREIQSLKCKV